MFECTRLRPSQLAPITALHNSLRELDLGWNGQLNDDVGPIIAKLTRLEVLKMDGAWLEYGSLHIVCGFAWCCVYPAITMQQTNSRYKIMHIDHPFSTTLARYTNNFTQSQVSTMRECKTSYRPFVTV